MQKSRILPIILLIVLTSCVSTRYVGNYYPPTNEIDIYFDENDLPKKSIIIGHIVGVKGSPERITSTIKEEAMQNGANAILIKEVDIESSDDTDKTKIKAALIRYVD